jgi:hypothetical protein
MIPGRQRAREEMFEEVILDQGTRQSRPSRAIEINGLDRLLVVCGSVFVVTGTDGTELRVAEAER